ncbi:MAG: creatininase family protein [Alphaproteobacteria bacterium]|nr:creatininase family protein [Alphaproteobacteria bacterium]
MKQKTKTGWMLIVAVFFSTVICHPSYASKQKSSPLKPPPSVYLEDLTWMEIRERMDGGAKTVIIPTGGTEQNGPHLAVGKHNFIVRQTAGDIARRLGHVLVAPVIAYVPEGRIHPPEGHMQFPGTISIRSEVLELVLEDAARSFKQHGFTTIALIGDHGGSQEAQKKVAEKLSREWQKSGVTVVHVSDYYDSANGQEKWARGIQLKDANPTAHGGYFDSSELLAIKPDAVRKDKFAARGEADYLATGAMGDSTDANADHGRFLLKLKADAAVDQILRARAAAGKAP